MFDSELAKLIAKHANRGILVDSNLLFVFLVGSLDSSLLQQEKRTKEYTAADFRVLQQFLGRFRILQTTPNIMTEVSNLAWWLRTHIRLQVASFVRNNVVSLLEEHYVPTRDAFGNYLFEKLGLSDAAIGVLAEQGMLVLSNDLNLSLLLESRRLDCVHYDRTLRPIALDMK